MARSASPQTRPSVDYLSGLYSRQSCYADTSTIENLQALHIPTRLEQALETWLRQGKDVVIVGNPGDGKTHLIRHLEHVMGVLGVRSVLDGSQEESYAAIARSWKTAIRARKPFCLAINHGPLTSMLQECDEPVRELEEVRKQRLAPLYYDTPPSEPSRVIVVDLNLRSVLIEPLVKMAIARMAAAASDALGVSGCPEGSDLSINLRAMATETTAERLVQLLTLAGHAGRHVTMRDLLGLLSFLIFGNKTAVELGIDPYSRRSCYYNLCFEGEGPLFESISDALKPERVTLPVVDEHLWENTGVNDGWAFGRPLETPDHLDNAWELFTSLKRRYFFEHEDGMGLLEVPRDATTGFFRVLRGAGQNPGAYLPTVIRAINSFFCPQRDEDGESLRLWNSQRYDNLPPHILVSTRAVPKDRFELLLPKLPPWLHSAMDYQPDHIYLHYKGAPTGSVASSIGLRIDRAMWATLMKSVSGVPMAIRSVQHAQQLQTFIGRVQYHERSTATTVKALIYNIALTRVERLAIDSVERRYVEA